MGHPFTGASGDRLMMRLVWSLGHRQIMKISLLLSPKESRFKNGGVIIIKTKDTLENTALAFVRQLSSDENQPKRSMMRRITAQARTTMLLVGA